MRVAPDRRLTVDEFLANHAHRFDRAELVDGEIRLMAGGSAAHVDVAVDLVTALRVKLRGTGCRPYSSDMALKITENTFRLPDVAIYCDPRDLDLDRSRIKHFRYPKVLIEVLSPSTENFDKSLKVEEYMAIDTVRCIVLVNPSTRRIIQHTRVEGDRWDTLFLMPGVDLVLADPAVTLTAAEIFATD